jgi:hypothetical protein
MLEINREPELSFWVEHIEAYERESKKWETKSKKIVKRYTDSRTDSENRLSRFNILWSNVQTLHPALYNGTPTPNIDRRYEDDEEVNTTAALVLERTVSKYVKSNDFDDCMSQAVLDRLLPGRGTVWVRYVPNFKDAAVQGTEEVRQEGIQLTDDVMLGDDYAQELYSEDTVLDYVHWQDFGHSVSRTWQECRAVWRKVYLGRKELIERFGQEIGSKVPLDAKAMGEKEDDKGEKFTKAAVYELWDRKTKTVFWIHKSMENLLDKMEDPLRLEGFWPCPKPLFATLGNDSLMPTPDYILYQDQAGELDMLTGRIDALTKALKIVGVYDSSAQGLQNMLTQNKENYLIPVEQWAVFAEKGGIKGAVDFFPVEMVANVLINLYQARDKIKQDIYEITGISDIVRGQTNANETATAQQIKGQFATLRLDSMRNDVSRFSRDCVKLMTEVIAEHFSIDTLKEASGVRLLTEQEKQVIMMSQQPSIDQMGQPVPPKPLPDNIKKMLDKPTWEQVEALIRSNGARCFKIDIETDSTIKADQEAEKASRIEFLTAAGGFIQQAATIPVPELQPLLMEMLKFGVGGFKAGRELENEFKATLDAIKARAEQPPVAQPDPAAEQAKLAQQESQMKLGFEDKKLGIESDLKGRELALKDRELAIKEADMNKKYDLENKRMIIEGKSKVSDDVAMTDADLNGGINPLMMLAEQMAANAQQTNAALMQIAQMQQQGNEAIIAALNKKKTVDVRRDNSGKMISAEVN